MGASATVKAVGNASGVVNDSIYTVTVSGMSGEGTVTVAVPKGVVEDAAGNYNLASNNTGNSVTYTGLATTIRPATGQATGQPSRQSNSRWSSARRSLVSLPTT